MSKENNLTDFLTDLGSAIRDKRGKANFINAQDFANEVRAIEPLLDTLDVTENGNHDVKDYKNVNVFVVSDDFKDLKNAIERTSNKIVIPYGITKIGARVFADLEDDFTFEFTNPELITEIGADAFYGTKMPNINIFTNVEVIKEGAFRVHSGSVVSWTQLTYDIRLPNLKELGANAFLYRSTNYSKVYISLDFPNLETLGYGSFKNMLIKTLNIPKIKEYSESCFEGTSFQDKYNFNIPDIVEKLGNGCFKYSNIAVLNLSNFPTLPDSVCREMIYLEKVILNENLSIIPGYAFYNTNSLKEIIIPASVSEIKNYALSLSNLTINMKSETPCTITTTSFKTTGLKIYVPKGTSATYKSATNWSSYASYIFEKYVVFMNIPSSLLNNETITYSIDGGKTYQQFTSGTLSLDDVATIKIKSTDASQKVLVGTSAGASDVGTISNSELTFSFTTDTNVYLTIQ